MSCRPAFIQYLHKGCCMIKWVDVDRFPFYCMHLKKVLGNWMNVVVRTMNWQVLGLHRLVDLYLSWDCIIWARFRHNLTKMNLIVISEFHIPEYKLFLHRLIPFRIEDMGYHVTSNMDIDVVGNPTRNGRTPDL